MVRANLEVGFAGLRILRTQQFNFEEGNHDVSPVHYDDGSSFRWYQHVCTVAEQATGAAAGGMTVLLDGTEGSP